MRITHEKPWYFSSLVSFIGEDIPQWVGISPARFAQDIKTLERRVASEGESFLTRTLPRLGKSIDLALQERQPLVTREFRKKSRRDARPLFLWALHRLVFTDTGELAAEPNLIAIKLLRQVCFWFKKVQKGFNDESLRRSLEELVNIDSSLPDCGDLPLSRALVCAKAVIDSIFRNSGFRISCLQPKHGPGAVAGIGSGPMKRSLNISYQKLEEVFRPIPWFRTLNEASSDPRCVYGRTKREYGVSEVTFVEKDSSGPRVIGLEPAEYMWCQQAVKSWLYSYIEKHRITKGHVNFTNQEINRDKTRFWEDWDTLDMSKASDRNSLALVEFLFKDTDLLSVLLACRTPYTKLPDGRIIKLKKFAPMGSAVCFPVEALVFYSLAAATLHTEGGIPLQLALRLVFVYGDDLIVPHGFFAILKSVFESVSLRFNDDKSCYGGKFRESCGCDTFNSFEVTPVRFKRPYAKHIIDFIPIIEHTNSLMLSGYWNSALALRKAALKQFPDLRKLNLPYTTDASIPILAWYSLTKSTVKKRTINSLTYIQGWQFRPLTMESKPELEVRHLHESLSRGGPVGVIRLDRDVRVLNRRFAGNLQYKKKVLVSPATSAFTPQ